MRAAGWLVVGFFACSACEDEEQAQQAPTSTLTTVPPTAAPTSTAELPGAAYEDADLPVAADFADEAAEAVPLEGDAYQRALAEMEEKLGGDPKDEDEDGDGDEPEEARAPEKAGEAARAEGTSGASKGGAPEPEKAGETPARAEGTGEPKPAPKGGAPEPE